MSRSPESPEKVAPRGPTHAESSLRVGLGLSVLVLLCACTPGLRLGPRVEDPARIARLRPEVRSPFPEEASILNEVRVLLPGNAPTFFTGQVWYRAPDDLRVQAYSEMGVVLLDVLRRSGDVRSLTSLPGKLGDPRVARGMTVDLALLFLPRAPEPPFTLHAVAGGGWDLSSGPSGERVVYRFTNGDTGPTTIFVEENGKLAARIDMAAWSRFGPWNLPSQLDLHRPALDYTLSVDIVEVHPLSEDERPFRADPARAE